MFLARVVGEVVATVKHRDLLGRALLLVQPVDGSGAPAGRLQIAVDAAQAGPGDHVLVADEGNSAAQVLRRPRGAVRTVIVGIVDEVTRRDLPPPAAGAPRA
jgi:ethanolamine utilization protein EutN